MIGAAMAAERTGAMAMLAAYRMKTANAIVRPMVIKGTPVDFSSYQTCARVADDVGHGSRNMLTSQSG